MKILFIPVFNKGGGAYKHFKNVVDLINKRGHELYLVLDGGQINFLDKDLEGKIRGKYKIKSFFQNNGNFINTSLMEISELLKVYLDCRPDMIIVSSTIPGKYLSTFIFPAKTIYFLHTYPEYNLNKFAKFILKNIISSKNKIVTVSEFSKKQILKLWFDNKNNKQVSYIYNYSDGENNINDLEHPHKRVVLTVGHVVDYKNPGAWIAVASRVMSKITNASFVWAGDGDLLNKMKKQIQNNNLKGVHFVGYKNDVDYLYNTSTIYFQPSLIESHGIAVVEAMAHSLPCVVSNRGGLLESVNNGVNGYVVDANDVDGYASKIISLLKNDSLRRKMGDNSRKIFEKKFSYDIWERKMSKLLFS